MNRMRRLWLAALTVMMGTAMAACGGGSAYAPPSGPSDAKQGYSQPEPQQYAPSGDSYGGEGGPAPELAAQPSAMEESEMAPPAPPPPSGAVGQQARPSATSTSAPRKSAPRDRGDDRVSEVAPEPTARPGLGTEWGETRSSRITTAPFTRADASTPFVTTALFYNDEEGARAMSSASGFQRMTGGTFRVANGVVQVGLRDERGSFLTGFSASGRNYVVGEAGRRYTIVVRNLTSARFEIVLSVDGLDVLDGKAASFGKRGYLIDPNGELEVDGFRQSTESVAAFRFGSVRNSYASQKHGETRNVGVIGVALFHERGTNPFQWTQQEVEQRHDANPFPGQFATPPR